MLLTFNCKGWEFTVVSVRFYMENDAIYKTDIKFPRTTTKGKFINHLSFRELVLFYRNPHRAENALCRKNCTAIT